MKNLILGINAYHGDASACLLRDGELIAAAEEERFKRIKHWAGFPTEAIRYCLQQANATVEELDHIAINRDPYANIVRKAIYVLTKKPDFNYIAKRISNRGNVKDILQTLANEFRVPANKLKAKQHYINHHQAHVASSFLVSPFNRAAVVSVDGFGDFESTIWGNGLGSQITITDHIYFPHSLGIFYSAMTQYLGFPHYGDEYKIMGLAPYGNPIEIEKIRKIVNLHDNGKFSLNLNYFNHHRKNVAMEWEGGEPKIAALYSSELEQLLGKARGQSEPLTDYHKNIAAATQSMYEETFFHVLRHVARQTKEKNLTISGGCAMNSVANGKIYEQTDFKNVYIQSAAGDAGGAIGAAFLVWNQRLSKPRTFQMNHSYWGPAYDSEAITRIIEAAETDLARQGCKVRNIADEQVLCKETAIAISEGKVIGWFQGRMEWGPRALGNRSILGDPRRADMKEILNLKIKKRESFRPFAPSILRSEVSQWFETDVDVPFMLQVLQIKLEKRKEIPAVTHVNGSGRLQTVEESQNPRYYRLIQSFKEITQVPILLNTSFNENEPVVCSPEQALNCFLRTNMDVLVLGNYFICRN